MNARDEAIEAMSDAMERQEAEYSGAPAYQLALVAIDAVPAGVLARLAIERGGLVDTTFAQTSNETVYACTSEWNPDDHGHARLYRLIEP